ncbi:LegC family aminotransferase [Alphaproteobacteria bacterium]|nr:LegC family aminotransferase [Alphaproteobacteria bacterium]
MDIKKFTNEFIQHVRSMYGDGFIPLHRPVFDYREKELVSGCIESNFVSSAGKEISMFEKGISDITGSKFAISTISGTAALHVVLHALGANQDTEVITQCLSFVATANAIAYCGAKPVFLDVEEETGTLSTNLLLRFLEENTYQHGGKCFNKETNKHIIACIPMHTFGHPCDIDEIVDICATFNVVLVEDAAEALGSYRRGCHVGNKALAATYSFNGNKIVTTGGGGCITTNDKTLAERLKHLTTTAKRAHPYEYFHDEIGFNYRLPNLNACLGIAQLEKFERFVEIKRDVFLNYANFVADQYGCKLWKERSKCRSNYWLNALSFSSSKEKSLFLKETNANSIMTRPIWSLLTTLPQYALCQSLLDGTAKRLYNTTVNIPSSVPKLHLC